MKLNQEKNLLSNGTANEQVISATTVAPDAEKTSRDPPTSKWSNVVSFYPVMFAENILRSF